MEEHKKRFDEWNVRKGLLPIGTRRAPRFRLFGRPTTLWQTRYRCFAVTINGSAWLIFGIVASYGSFLLSSALQARFRDEFRVPRIDFFSPPQLLTFAAQLVSHRPVEPHLVLLTRFQRQPDPRETSSNYISICGPSWAHLPIQPSYCCVSVPTLQHSSSTPTTAQHRSR